MTHFSEERLARLIAVLPPAPGSWVQAAIELPHATAAIDQLVTRARGDDAARMALLADLEGALRAAGVEPERASLDALRARLAED